MVIVHPKSHSSVVTCRYAYRNYDSCSHGNCPNVLVHPSRKHCRTVLPSYRRDAVSWKDNHHDHTARHSAPVYTCISAMWSKLIVHVVCPASMHRVVWSWWLSFQEIAELAPLKLHDSPSVQPHATPQDEFVNGSSTSDTNTASWLSPSFQIPDRIVVRTLSTSSTSRFPSLLCICTYMCHTALLNILSWLGLNMCLSHCNRRSLMTRTKYLLFHAN